MKINNTFRHCEEGFSPTKQSQTLLGDCFVAMNAPRNDMNEKEGAL